MKYLGVLALLAASFLVCGCQPQTEAQKREALQQFTNSALPSGAKNVRELGNGWRYFEVELEGRNRKFLYRSSGCGNSNTETVTELSE